MGRDDVGFLEMSDFKPLFFVFFGEKKLDKVDTWNSSDLFLPPPPFPPF